MPNSLRGRIAVGPASWPDDCQTMAIDSINADAGHMRVAHIAASHTRRSGACVYAHRVRYEIRASTSGHVQATRTKAPRSSLAAAS